MGETYFYGKIVSMFGQNFMKGKKGMNKFMSYMMMSEMMKGMNGNSSSMNNMLPFMMMGGNLGDMFGDIFDDAMDFGSLISDNEEKEEEEK